MNEWELEAEEFLARAVCHELDHLEGHLYVEKVNGELRDASELQAVEEEEESSEEEQTPEQQTPEQE
jgi:peptide deformylase